MTKLDQLLAEREVEAPEPDKPKRQRKPLSEAHKASLRKTQQEVWQRPGQRDVYAASFKHGWTDPDTVENRLRLFRGHYAQRNADFKPVPLDEPVTTPLRRDANGRLIT